MLKYSENQEICSDNIVNSPAYDIFRTAELFGLYKDVIGMMHGTKVFFKNNGRIWCWGWAWEIENQD